MFFCLEKTGIEQCKRPKLGKVIKAAKRSKKEKIRSRTQHDMRKLAARFGPNFVQTRNFVFRSDASEM